MMACSRHDSSNPFFFMSASIGGHKVVESRCQKVRAPNLRRSWGPSIILDLDPASRNVTFLYGAKSGRRLSPSSKLLMNGLPTAQVVFGHLGPFGLLLPLLFLSRRNCRTSTQFVPGSLGRGGGKTKGRGGATWMIAHKDVHFSFIFFWPAENPLKELNGEPWQRFDSIALSSKLSVIIL